MARGEAKNISGEETRDAILRGAEQVYRAVSATYGPTSGNVAIQRNYGDPTITHDGVSVAKEVIVKDPVEDIGAGLLVNASQKSNDVSGDGTSATVLLGYHIIQKARKAIAAGFNPMGLRRGIDQAARDLTAELTKLAKPVDDKDLAKVAAISASDPEIGKLVADTVIKVGGVGITVEEYEGLGVIQDVVNGLYFEKGWTMPHFVTDRTTEEAVHDNPNVLLLEKRIKQNQDIVPIIEMAFASTQHKTLLIIGHVEGQALETCALTNLHGGVKIVVVAPPVYGDQELPFLEDVAALTGAKVVSKQMASSDVKPEYLGNARKVIVARDHTTIFDGQAIQEDVDHRIASINEQLKSDKYSAFQKERMEFRLAKLQGKIGIIRVGGATAPEQKEMKFRVEDAIHATRAAKAEGIVPGGATTLARLSSTPFAASEVVKNPDQLAGYKIVLEALAEPFKQLMANAGEDGGYRLKQVQKAKAGEGFNVMEMTDDPIELIPAGVMDPVKVIKSVVENACSVAGLAITIPVAITIDREWQMEQLQINKAHMGG